MKIQSRFTKVAVAAGLVVMSGAAVLGITSIASAQVGQQSKVVAVVDAADSTNTTVPGAPVAPEMHADRPSPLISVAKTLNMTEAELKAQLTAGKSVADVAKAQNVDIDTVIAALTTEFTAHLAEEVTSGEHTQAEADAKLAEFSTRLDDMVNNVRPAGGPEGHGKGGPGRGHGPMGDAPTTAPTAQGTSASA